MRRIHLFCEDAGHEQFLKALLNRLARRYAIEIEIKVNSARGGHGRMRYRLRNHIKRLREGRINAGTPDLIVVVRDANCSGLSKMLSALKTVVEDYDPITIYAIPDPHLERWLLLDSSAFKDVLGRGCSAPDQKYEKDRYKKLLIEAVLNTGETPVFGGIEHTEDIVNAMDLERMVTADPSLGSLITEVRRTFSSWSHQD